MIEREPGLHRRLQELFNNLRQGTLYLRKLVLPSDGLMIGNNRLVAKASPAGIIDGYWQRVDGTESNISGDSPGARVYNSVNISVPNNIHTALTFNSERWDTDNIHEGVTNPSRLTCRTAGKYLICGTIGFVVNTTGRRWSGIRLNGAAFIALSETDPTTVGFVHQTPVGVYDLAVGDYVELVVYQSSGAALDVAATGNYSPEFMMMRLGPSGTGAPAGGDGADVATDTIWDALGDILYGTGPDAGTRLAPNTTTTKKFLTQTGTGAASAAPAWDDHLGATDPHTGYQKESEKGEASGYAGLDAGATVPDAQLPAGLMRDTEHGADPHTMTIDGVDVSDHAANANAHHARYTDTEAVAAVPYELYIMFGADPINGQAFAP